MMVDKLLQEQHQKILSLSGKGLHIVDNHQYALLVWAKEALKRGRPGILVSIDYHPDTNPPFWLYAFQKAVAIDPEREAALVARFQEKLLREIDPGRLESLGKKMPLMRNDEHINTAMALGYLEDYHMINCMEKHRYAAGHHYLVPEEKFGDLSDGMFKAAGFDLADLSAPEKSFLILDIDLDYFMRRSDFEGDTGELSVFKALLKKADLITCARSVTYFDHLKTEDFSISECEEALLGMLKKLLQAEGKLENA